MPAQHLPRSEQYRMEADKLVELHMHQQEVTMLKTQLFHIIINVEVKYLLLMCDSLDALVKQAKDQIIHDRCLLFCPLCFHIRPALSTGTPLSFECVYNS